MNKVLTVTVPCYNVEKFIGKTIESFIENTILDDIEILIVNDGSKDSTLEIARGFESQYPDTVKVIDKENGGHGSTINSGISVATGKYFKVVDGDDWVDTAEFAQFVKKLKNCDEDVVLASFNEVNSHGDVLKERRISGFPENVTLNLSDIITKIGDDYCMHAATYRTGILKDNVVLTEKCFYVDQEFINFALKTAKTVRIIDNNVYQYRLGDVNQSVSVSSYQRNREMLKKVIFNLLEFYTENIELWGDEVKLYFNTRFIGLIKMLINVYLSLPLGKEALGELKNFVMEVGDRYFEFYNGIPGITARIMRCNITLGYIFGWFKRYVTNNNSI